MNERVQKILSQRGIASRRQAEQWIQAGRVRLNGAIAQLGQTADPTIDQIEVDGQVICGRPDLIYLLLNKPAGVVSTCTDPWGRTTVIDLLAPDLRQGQGIYPVGRLDADSTGALLLTNDGDFTFHLTHPRHQIAKTYAVWVAGSPSETTLNRWRTGVMLDGRITLPAEIAVLERANGKTLLQVILNEGRNRQIRRVADLLEHRVLSLHRQGIGAIRLDAPNAAPLASGQYRPLENAEISLLKSQIDLRSERVPVKRSKRL